MLRLQDEPAEAVGVLIDVIHDKLVIIKIEGLHSHQCEQAIQATLGREDGVHEVEVDFLSGQCSVLYDPTKVRVEDLVSLIDQAGYRPGETSLGGLGVEA